MVTRIMGLFIKAIAVEFIRTGFWDKKEKHEDRDKIQHSIWHEIIQDTTFNEEISNCSAS